MTTLPKQTASFEFGRVRQEDDPKHLQIGELTEVINLKRTKGKAYQKRPGYSRTVPTFTGASFTGPPDTLLPGDGTSLLMLDAADQAWALDADAVTYRDRGKAIRTYPRNETIIPLATKHARPLIVEAGNHMWYFGQVVASATTAGQPYYTVVDTTTGIVIVPPTSFATNNIAWDAAYDGTYVWVVTANGGTTATSYKFTASTPSSSPTSATYTTIAAAVIRQVALRRLSFISETAVVVASFVAGGNSIRQQSYLDPATGAAKVAPAPVTTTIANAGQVYTQSGLSIIVHDGGPNGSVAGNRWYYTIWSNDGTAVSATLYLIEVLSSDLSTVATIATLTAADTAATYGFGVSSGYLISGIGVNVFGQYEADAVSGALRPDNYAVSWGQYTSFTVWAGFGTFALGAWLASQPVLYGGLYYILVGYDDVAVAPVTANGIQRTFRLIETGSKDVVSQIAYGNGSGAYYTVDYQVRSQTAESTFLLTHLPALIASGDKIFSAIATQQDADISLAKLEVSMNESFGRAVMIGNNIAMAPGGVPVAWSKTTRLHDAGTLAFPSYVRRTAGAGATETALAAVYRIDDPDGTVWRSSPVLVTGSFGAGDTIEVPTMRAFAAETSVKVEIYAGTSTPKLQGTVASNPAVNTVTFTLPTPINATGETLYTTGGALSNSPPPVSRSTMLWRERVFLTSGDDVYFSQEIREGFGPQFNEILKVTWHEGTGDILAIGVVDWNYLALFKRDAVAVISGPGPDGRGSGNYTVQTLTTKMGCAALGSIASGPSGCYFQDVTTGRICLVAPSLQVVECAGGGENYITETITAAAHVEATRLMQFHTSGPKVIVIDYRHPTESAVFGQVYVWQSSGLLQGYSACVDNTGPVHIETSGILRRPQATFVDATSGTAAKVLGSLTTGDMAPLGIQGEFSLCWVHFLGTNIGGTHGVIQITLTRDFGVFGADTIIKARSDSPTDQIATRPQGMARIQAIRCKVEELDADSPAGGTAAFDFEGIVLTYQSRNRAKVLGVDNVI